MSLSSETILRYRGEGHVRFDLAPGLCREPERLIATLRRTGGVYRVDISHGSRKLSIRYLPEVLSFGELLQSLADAVKAVEASPAADIGAAPGQRFARIRAFAPLRWLRGKAKEAKETATALKIVANRGLREHPARGWARPLLNDILIFYLIRTHWVLVTRYWLRNPLEHRNHWIALTYLAFLLLRTRRSLLLSAPSRS